MVTTVFDRLGYWRIGKLVAALKPIKRISRLTTSDSTGRLMKRSVMAMTRRSVIGFVSRGRFPPKTALIQRRLRRNRRCRIGRDHDRGAGLQLELSDGHHPVARLQAADD